ncbi:hypothetical protein BSZ36_00895 [Rubricoccus marinus]|uniref:Uncharacterized protein n=1 Tax=Rubricoccus marinus TaxID=716817 RepID=A0A259TVA5_9BACT|nr:hypothetical protein BSZ36_00895 [Rubricoccus marinus]
MPLVIEVEDWNPFWNHLGLYASGLAVLSLAAFVYFRLDAWRRGMVPLASGEDVLNVGAPLAVMALGVWLMRRRVSPEVIETVTVDAEWLTVNRVHRQRVRIPRRSITEVRSLRSPVTSRNAARVVHARGALDLGPLRTRSVYTVDDAPDRFVTLLERALAPEASGDLESPTSA